MDDDARKKLKARVLLQAVTLGLQEISREDPAIRTQLRGWDRVIQYSVLPDGPHVHLIVSNGEITARPGPAEAPAATIRFADVEAAVAVLTRKLDPQQAFVQGKLQMGGDVADAMKIGLVMQMAGSYFQ